MTNPLLGALGAAAVFGPQKGADAATVDVLEANLARLADLMPDAVEPLARRPARVRPAAPDSGCSVGRAMGGGAALVAEAVGLPERSSAPTS